MKLFSEPASGLSCVIALHSTKLGPAAGGCRLWEYDSLKHAMADAVRLSRGMSFKNAFAGLPLGGGKAVILRPRHFDRGTLMREFGVAVESLKGAYITAEDVGTSVQDMKFIAERTPYVSGIAKGDPSPWTAKGVFLAMREAVRMALGRESMRDLTVAVQGIGSVGRHLCELLHKEGAAIIAADLRESALQDVETRFGATIVGAESIHKVACDVYAPCALGGGLNSSSIPEIAAKVICGGANNQLAT
ncbi:MAG TPA: Glu/Leu/Phe/Val dehydrogenase dimerization domain-containing protein, partial [Verrucomicrobiaceae bacterium]